jgi:membrane protease YdiL (CAAX protease family)
MISALTYLLAIAAAETVTVYVDSAWGTWCHVVVFTGLIVHSAVTAEQASHRLPLSLSLVPLVRVVSLSMPLAGVPQIWWYPLIYAPLLGATLVAARLLHYGRRELGISPGSVPAQFGIGLTGVAFGVIEYFILRPGSLIAELTWQSVWLPSLVFLVAVGFIEELIFRGLIQRSAMQALGWRGIAYVSLVFALLHMGFFSWTDVLFAFGIAVFFGWAVKKTGSLLGVTLSHGLANIVLYLIAPFLLG